MALCRFLVLILTVLFAYAAYFFRTLDTSVPEEFLYKTGDFIRKYGYHHEEHEVLSEDGFVTQIFRIVTANSKNGTRAPVLLEGGLFCSSDVMVLMGPGRDLAFILADEGFDVWLGNFRGNRYSRPGPLANHSDPHLLSYGYHEMGLYDFSATIDYIRHTTGHRRVDVASVSAGCGAMLALLSTRPEYNQRVRKVLHVGCGVSLKYDSLAQWVLFRTLWNFPDAVVKSGMLEPYQSRPLLLLTICVRTFFTPLCEGLLRAGGFPTNYNTTFATLVMTLLPSGNPMGVVDHLMQLTNSGEKVFRMRDWGREENLHRYNSDVPPIYDVRKVTAYTKSYTAEDDYLASYEIPTEIFRQLPNYAGNFEVGRPFVHANFFIEGAKSPLFIRDVVQTLST